MSEYAYLKVREVRSRFYGQPRTYEATIVRWRVNVGLYGWDKLGTTRGHATRIAALDAARKLAARRGIALHDDPDGKLLRLAEYRARYGEEPPT